MINNATQLLMMKADVLSSFEEISVCTHYKLPDGSLTQDLPHCLISTPVEPVYTTLKGWNCDLSHIKADDQLPQALSDYMRFIEDYTGVPITFLSYGPERSATLQRKAFYEA
jgi:adenylosuccinate synthase